jgi:hypothetical protein
MWLGLLTCVIASPPASDLVVRYDADGAPRALLWSGAPGPVLRSAEDPARIHEDVEAILDLARAPLGAPARGPLTDLDLVELVPAAASGPDGRGPVRSYARFRQRHRGVAIKHGDLRFLWRDGRLLRVNGRPRAVSELTGLDARLDAGATDGAELPTTLAARCPTRIELDAAPAEYDVRYQDLVRDVFCGQERWRVGLSDRAIHERGPRAHGWGPHAGGVTMTSVTPGTTDATVPWFPGGFFQNFAVQPGSLALHHNVLIDSEPRPGSPGNCNYRATHDGNPAAFPFPNVQVNGSLYYVSGSCTAGGSAFATTALSNALGFQVAYRAINTAARHAAWQSDLRLFAAVPWSTTRALTVDVSFNGLNVDYCPLAGIQNNDGAYDESTGRLCFDVDAALPVRTALHEYAHYVSARYGVDLSGGSCGQRAMIEGIADALSVSFEHFRYRPEDALQPAQLDALSLLGPGPGMRRTTSSTISPQGGEPRLARVDELVPAVTTCPTPPSDPLLPYYRAAAVSQVLWAMLMNRSCTATQGGNCTGVTRIGQQFTDHSYAIVVRDSFTWTMKLSDANSPFGFLQDFLDDLLTWYTSFYSAADAARVLAAFRAHSLSFRAPSSSGVTP